LAKDHHHRQGIIRRHGKQKWFSTKSPLSRVTVTIFTGLIVLLIMPSAPVFVFAANIDGTSGDDTLNGTDEAEILSMVLREMISYLEKVVMTL
jgi:hypothetical protein